MRLVIVISFLINSVSLAQQIPAQLTPTGDSEHFFCTNKSGAESIAIAYRENADCHAQLKTATSTTDWSTVIVAAAAALLTGWAVGQATK